MKQTYNKALIATCVCLIFLTIFSCQKKSENSSVNNKQASVDNLTKSLAFVKFIDNLETIEGHISNSNHLSPLEKDTLKQYLNSEKVSESELTKVSKYSGYNSLDNFVTDINNQAKIVSELKSEFSDIGQISIDSIYQAIIEVRYNKSNRVKVNQIDSDNLCKRIYDNCSSRASAVYTAAILGCTVTAIGISTISFGTLGVAFELSCGGTAYWYLMLQRDECSLNYESCIKSK